MNVVRVGVINLMPEAEHYEPMLARALDHGAQRTSSADGPLALQLPWIRLREARYASSDRDHLARHYRTWSEAGRGHGLDGLIVTGAPVETLPYDEVYYFRELSEVVGDARAQGISVLGLCWGGLALAKMVGIEKVHYPTKLFGVYPMQMQDDGSLVHCAQSRHAGIADRTLEAAAADGVVRLGAHGAEGGYSVFSSADGLLTMHLGHPEYVLSRLVFEYRRDRAAGRTDVSAPVGVDLTDPPRAAETHGPRFFADWLRGLQRERQ